MRAPVLRNGADAPKAQPPRRSEDDPRSDYRGRRQYYNGGGHNGDGSVGGPLVTSAMVSLAIGAVLLAANWLGFTRGEIDRALDPLRDGINNLQSAHGRLDDRVSVEISRINRDKVENSTRLEMLAELNRRLEALERGLVAASEHGYLVLQQVNGLNERVEDLRRRVLALERDPDYEYPFPPSAPYPPPSREGR